MKLGDLYKNSRGQGLGVFSDKMKDVELVGMEESGVLSFVSNINGLIAIERRGNDRINQAIAEFDKGDSESISGTALQNTILGQRTRWLMDNYPTLKASAGNLVRFGKPFEEISDLFITMGDKFGHQSEKDKKDLTIKRQEEVSKLYNLIPQALRAIGMDKHATSFENLVSEQAELLDSIGLSKASQSTRRGVDRGTMTPEELAAMQRRDASESGYDDGAELRGKQASQMDAIIRDQISRLPLNYQERARKFISGKGDKIRALQLFMQQNNI